MSQVAPRATGAQLLMLRLLATEFVLALRIGIGEYNQEVADPREQAAFINGPAVGVIIGYGVALLATIVGCGYMLVMSQ